MAEAYDTETHDKLVIRGLEIFAHHGVFDFERRDGQIFIIDLDLEIDTRTAAASDALSDTLDYGNLVGGVRAAVEQDPVDLIETLAQRIADVCLAHEMVHRVEVTVHKPNAPIEATFADVALRIKRSKP
ncbi:MAG TPA: dihydroneopterin aldolase [Marmoricola sp.]|nr:dihydroneopterin aldolase [Marmoricola sp.]